MKKRYMQFYKRSIQNYKIEVSKIAIFFTVIFTLVFALSFHRWDDDGIIVADAINYYVYLPAGVIYQDLDFEFGKEMPEDIVRKKLSNFPSPINRPVIKMTMGVAFFMLPFFTVGHIIASLSDTYANNGYSAPYYFMIFVSALFYLWVGLYYLRKLLLLFFEEASVAIVIILIVLATNLLFYVAMEPGVSHVYNFTLISMFLYFSFKWLSNPTYKIAILLGLLLGFITLIRPSNSIIVLFPLLILLFDKNSLQSKVLIIKENLPKILLALVFMIVVLIPQMIYWKLFTGQWLFYTYGTESFYFNNPHIFEGLLSYRKGWLIYTPIMFFSIVGLFFLLKKHARLVLPIIIFSSLNLYIIFSWWCWWYGGSYGARPMIDTYAIYAIPLAAFVQFFINKKIWKQLAIGSIFIFFIYFNTFQIRQYNIALLHYANMTKEAYWGILFKMHYPDNYVDLIQTPDYESAAAGKDEQLDRDKQK
ncbi:MAG TPA: hypothetical protein VIN10_09765 [Bacteroidales bacterium]